MVCRVDPAEAAWCRRSGGGDLADATWCCQSGVGNPALGQRQRGHAPHAAADVMGIGRRQIHRQLPLDG